LERGWLGTALVVNFDTLTMMGRKPTAPLVPGFCRIPRGLPKRFQANRAPKAVAIFLFDDRIDEQRRLKKLKKWLRIPIR